MWRWRMDTGPEDGRQQGVHTKVIYRFFRGEKRTFKRYLCEVKFIEPAITLIPYLVSGKLFKKTHHLNELYT